MDYSSYFAAATPQALQFFGLPPTPSYPDDKLDSAVESVDGAFFPPYDFRFSPTQQHAQQPQQQHNQASPLVPPSQPTSDASPPANSAAGIPTMNSVDSGIGLDSMGGMQGNDEASQGRTRSSSEEKDTLTPAQSRRKAQNRAAQRAFRERKERHVRDLEAKLSALESSATSLATDNERLKLALQQATTENEILRASGSSVHRLSVGSITDGPEGGMRTLGGPMGHGMGSQTDTSAGAAVAAAQALLARNDAAAAALGDPSATDGSTGAGDALASSVMVTADGTTVSNSPTVEASASSNQLLAAAIAAAAVGGPAASGASPLNQYTPHPARGSAAFLPAAATWDLIQAHPLVKRGVVDIADVCEALRGTARCDGQGPVFREEMVWRAVEGARRGGGDELI